MSTFLSIALSKPTHGSNKLGLSLNSCTAILAIQGKDTMYFSILLKVCINVYELALLTVARQVATVIPCTVQYTAV